MFDRHRLEFVRFLRHRQVKFVLFAEVKLPFDQEVGNPLHVDQVSNLLVDTIDYKNWDQRTKASAAHLLSSSLCDNHSHSNSNHGQ